MVLANPQNMGNVVIRYMDFELQRLHIGLLQLLHIQNVFRKQQIPFLNLAGGFNPFENISQIGSFPQGSGWKFQKYLKPPPSKFISK